ncbi:prepilin-type N-terminal cleavage/methylation domain-containing protein [Pseudoduganella lurida]|uniref:Prepilin-type N-terminal cleavage/methylation domain-containing protein n=1 Tax=Pseudoduganella lurida TaxID=1036180 RepID=A0A562RL30_9BURK|nr:prepilin-type N-terminal cleavage/methylation domain-containing protein [Pseudoduganella lurida]TWI69755.1 prepilin-type N-terminal cleavage/methylation domain-containing protein [Pseudoduganella lurida]
MRRQRAQAGFTLAELLAGIAIAAILILPLADMLRSGTEGARAVRATLDVNTDARLALSRIAQRAAAVTLPNPLQLGQAIAPESLFGKISYLLKPMVTNAGNVVCLVERDITSGIAVDSILAANATAFQLTVPEVVAGYPMLRIDLTLQGPDGSTVTRSRIVRLGAPA